MPQEQAPSHQHMPPPFSYVRPPHYPAAPSLPEPAPEPGGNMPQSQQAPSLMHMFPFPYVHPPSYQVPSYDSMQRPSSRTPSILSVDPVDEVNTKISRYHELGLGRGINVTDPEMWKNKSSFLVREVSLSPTNIIITDECGRKEAYCKEVSSFETQRQQIQLTLDDPVSQVKLGMDAQHSQSTSSSMSITGTKYETKTVSFKSDFNTVPLYTSMSDVSLSLPSDLRSLDSSFEHTFCSWILKRIRDQIDKEKTPTSDVPKDRANPNPTYQYHHSNPHHNDVQRLADTLKILISSGEERSKEKRKRNIECVSLLLANECKEFLNNLGVTHYVSAIKLGAMKYRAVTINSRQRAFGGGSVFGIGSAVMGGVSRGVLRGLFHKEEEEQHIGKLNDDGTVSDSGEAVIGFQIQPIDTLVRLQLLQVALRRAIKEYVQSKTDKCRKWCS